MRIEAALQCIADEGEEGAGGGQGTSRRGNQAQSPSTKKAIAGPSDAMLAKIATQVGALVFSSVYSCVLACAPSCVLAPSSPPPPLIRDHTAPLSLSPPQDVLIGRNIDHHERMFAINSIKKAMENTTIMRKIV